MYYKEMFKVSNMCSSGREMDSYFDNESEARAEYNKLLPDAYDIRLVRLVQEGETEDDAETTEEDVLESNSDDAEEEEED